MIDPNASQVIRIACAPGLAEYLRGEIVGLGHVVERAEPTAVEVAGTLADAQELNLRLRTALHVHYLLAEFTCADANELHKALQTLAWEELIDPDGYFSVTSTVRTPTITDWKYANLRVKDAIVDRIAARAGRRPDSGPDRERMVIHLDWQDRHARVFMNTSGRKLSDRNYRKLPHAAPMQETLAAAVILATGYDGSQPLVNPMCGSGTLAIEAALIAGGRLPGLLRSNFGFMHWRGFDPAAWQAQRRVAKKIRRTGPIAPIIASDHDERALHAARKNAETAGVHHLIRFEHCDFAASSLPDQPGIVILNPEYGQRLGELCALEKTYGAIGDFFKQRCCGWTGYVFTGNRELAKKIGLRASRRMEFRNAKIDCRLLKYEMYAGTRRTNFKPPHPADELRNVD
jgi:putative N6-adenine-specific DNA methylase